MAYVVVVEHTKDGETKTERIITDVSNRENAIPQAKARHPGPGYHWDNAKVEQE
jgi:hypothetical protein